MKREKFIYALINPLNNKIFYIGYTNCLRNRLNGHMKCKCNKMKFNIINEISKSGLKPIITVIDKCDYVYNNELKMFEHERLEKYYIKKYKEEGIVLTNMTIGGGDTISSLKKRIYKYNQFGKFINEYESISVASIAHNIGSRNIGHAVDQKNKNTSCGHYWFTSKEKARNFVFKVTTKDDLPVLQYSLDGVFINEFKNRKDAENLLNIGRGSISRVIKTNGKKSTGGYLWFYRDNKPEIVKKYRKSNYKEISQYDLNGNFVKSYATIKEASKESNICDVSIINCAKGKYSHAGGFIWKYK